MVLVLVVRVGTGGEEEDVLIPRRAVAGTANAEEEDRKADDRVGAKPMVRSSRYIHSKILWRAREKCEGFDLI